MTYAGLLAQGGEGITAKGTCQVIGRDLLVGTSADPRLRNVAVSARLQFLYEIAETSAQHASCSGATKQATQSTRQQVAQTSAGLSTSWRCTWLTAEQPAQNIAEPATSIAGIYVAACG